MDPGGGEVAVLTVIRTVAETGSTNADLLALARIGSVDEGMWLRAERQTAGRGRQGRAWLSPSGNLFASTAVRLQSADPPAPTLGFVAAVALHEVVAALLPSRTREGMGEGMSASPLNVPTSPPLTPPASGRGMELKWPNDLLIAGAKVSGILLERAEGVVVVGIGVNLAHHPDLPERPTTSLGAHGVAIAPATFAEMLAESFADWLRRWRNDGYPAIRQRWLECAHPSGTRLRAALPDGTAIEGAFDDIDQAGALIMRLASGERRAIHAGDVFLV